MFDLCSQKIDFDLLWLPQNLRIFLHAWSWAARCNYSAITQGYNSVHEIAFRYMNTRWPWSIRPSHVDLLLWLHMFLVCLESTNKTHLAASILRFRELEPSSESFPRCKKALFCVKYSSAVIFSEHGAMGCSGLYTSRIVLTAMKCWLFVMIADIFSSVGSPILLSFFLVLSLHLTYFLCNAAFLRRTPVDPR